MSEPVARQFPETRCHRRHPEEEQADAAKRLDEGSHPPTLGPSHPDGCAGIAIVFAAGGGAHLPGLGQFLASASRLPVSFGDGLARLKVSGKLRKDVSEGRESLVAIAVGLAFGEVGA